MERAKIECHLIMSQDIFFSDCEVKTGFLNIEVRMALYHENWFRIEFKIICTIWLLINLFQIMLQFTVLNLKSTY